MTSPLAAHWDLDPAVVHLNHGSFGAAPRRVLEAQSEWRRLLEANPVRFFARDLADYLDAARNELAAFVGGHPSQLAFVPNASAGVNAVLRSLSFEPGDEVLVTNHGYGAANNAADYVAEQTGAALVIAQVPAAPQAATAIVQAIVESTSDRTRLALVDHVTSATGIVFPIAEIVSELETRGIPTLIDGAHAPGMLDLDVTAIGATYYVGNCHKWMCAPKGAGFLHVRDPADAETLVPVVVGWGRSVQPEGRSQFHSHFDWVGTADPSPYLSVPSAIEVMGGLLPGGWPELRRRNHDLAVAAQRVLCDHLGVEAPVPSSIVGAMATVPLPDAADAPRALAIDPLQQRLSSAGIEVAITYGPEPTRRWIRLSAAAYNEFEDYERLAALL